jgi:hypothetical protein
VGEGVTEREGEGVTGMSASLGVASVEREGERESWQMFDERGEEV